MISRGDAPLPAGADMKLQFYLLLDLDKLCNALIVLFEILHELSSSV
jgi:hypothetical protein